MIALLVLGVALLGEVAPPPAPPAALSLTVRTPEGVKFSLEVTKEEAERGPEWQIEEGQPPPLSMKLAIDLARDSVKHQNPDIEVLELQGVDIERFGGGLGDRWYYIISFNPSIGGRTLRGSGYTALVLMDGTVKKPDFGGARPSD
jgi:hypothetical protein